MLHAVSSSLGFHITHIANFNLATALKAS